MQKPVSIYWIQEELKKMMNRSTSARLGQSSTNENSSGDCLGIFYSGRFLSILGERLPLFWCQDGDNKFLRIWRHFFVIQIVFFLFLQDNQVFFNYLSFEWCSLTQMKHQWWLENNQIDTWREMFFHILIIIWNLDIQHSNYSYLLALYYCFTNNRQLNSYNTCINIRNLIPQPSCVLIN